MRPRLAIEVCLWVVVALLGTASARAQDGHGAVVAWGRNNFGQCNVPAPNSGFIAVAGGGDHSLGLKADARGDLNCDGWIDFADIDPFVLALSDPAAYQAAYPNCDLLNGDINADGLVDFGDIDPFVALLAGG